MNRLFIRSHLISSHLGFVHPLQDVALHQCLPSSSVCCFPNPGGSLLLCLCHLAIFCLVVLSSSSLSLAATLCIALSTYCPLILLYDRPISTFVSVCILWYRWPLFFFWFPSMVSYLSALGLTFSFPLLFERFSVCLSFVYLETMFGSHRSWLARYFCVSDRMFIRSANLIDDTVTPGVWQGRHQRPNL